MLLLVCVATGIVSDLGTRSRGGEAGSRHICFCFEFECCLLSLHDFLHGRCCLLPVQVFFVANWTGARGSDDQMCCDRELHVSFT